MEEQMVLLSSGLSSIAFANGRAVGFLGLTSREAVGTPPERWADLRMLALGFDSNERELMPALLSAVTPALLSVNATGIVALVAEDWLRHLLDTELFAEIDQIVSYVHRGVPAPEPTNSEIKLRPATPRDTDTILHLNELAFSPFWRYDLAKTLSWLLTADHPIVAELEDQPVGFALTTNGGNGDYAHLIRVGIDPDAQGRGIGKALVLDAIQYAGTRDFLGLALNTQASNRVSRHLYETLGFVLASPTVSVMVYRL